MSLSKYAQEQVDEKIKDLWLAYFSGSNVYYTYNRSVPMQARECRPLFQSWMNRQHPDLVDHVNENKCFAWLS